MSIYKSSSLAMIPTAYKDGRLYSIRPVEQLGSELVTNGDFSGGSTGWTLGTGWTISGGKANVASGSDGAALSQDISKVGVVNKVVFTISNYTGSGFIRLRTGDASQVQDFSANGTYSFEVTPTTTTFSFARYMNGSLSIDNVSVKEVLKPSGDFDFSRGSNLAATRVASSGYIEKGRENLYTQSNNFSHSDWTPKAGTFTQGETDPNGGTDAWAWEATNTDPYLYQSKNFTGVHTLSIYVKGVGSTIGDDFQIRVGTALKDVTLTGHWQRVEHFAVLSGSINIGFEYGNPATAGDIVHIYAAQLELGTIATDYIDSGSSTAQAGILEDMPRLDYSGSATCPSLLLEPQRTNSATHSEYFGAWSAFRATITDNSATSPEGVSNAAVLTEDTTTNSHPLNKTFSVSSGAEYTLSIFAKQGSRRYLALLAVNGGSTIYYDLQEKTAGSGGSVEDYGNGWLRLIYTYTTNSTSAELYIQPSINGSSVVYTGDGSNAVFLYGAQLEAGSYPTSYIPTYGSSVTRSVDSCLATSVSDVIGQSSGTLFVDFITPDTDSYFIHAISDGTNNNKVQIEYNTTANTIKGIVRVSATTSVDITATGKVPDTRYKAAIAYAENDFVFYVNGVKIGTDTSGSIPPSMSRIDIGTQLGTFFGAGDVNQMVLFQTKLTDSELAALTTI